MCEGCEEWVSHPPELCLDCFNRIQFLDEGVCQVCGLPWEGGLQSAHLCRSCLTDPPTYEKVYAALRFNEKLGELLHGVKFGKRVSALKVLARMGEIGFARALADYRPDFIVPVPLSWRRQLSRGFNQSFLLSQYLLKGIGEKLPIFSKVGREFRQAQATLDRKSRLASIKGVFKLENGEAIRGKKILIIDDVLTTGATLEELSSTLSQQGVWEIRAFVLGRVGRLSN